MLLVPKLIINVGEERELGIERTCKRQILHIFHVNHNLRDPCLCAVTGQTSEMDHWRFALGRGGPKHTEQEISANVSLS